MPKGVLAGLALFLVAAGAAYVGGQYLLFTLDPAKTPPAVPSGVTEYRAEELDLSFSYPSDRYDIRVHRDGNAEREWYTLVFLPKDYLPPADGEGPPTITIQMFPNFEEQALESWIRGDARSNFKLSDGTLTPATVDGEPAYSYHHSGLYETDAIAASHGGNVYLLSVGWLSANDRQVRDFNDLIPTVQFTK